CAAAQGAGLPSVAGIDAVQAAHAIAVAVAAGGEGHDRRAELSGTRRILLAAHGHVRFGRELVAFLARRARVLADGRVAAECAETHGAVVENTAARGHATVGDRRALRGDASRGGIVVEPATITVAQAGERK